MVFLAGRTLDRVAGEISVAGGVAETARVDALDEQAVEGHIGEVVELAGSIDISFNAISIRDVLTGGTFPSLPKMIYTG